MGVTLESWPGIRDAFLEAAEMGAIARAQFLEALRSRDACLWQEVRELLRAHDEADAIVDRSACELAGCAAEAEEDPRVGKRLGAYEVLSILGRGGMGTVYRARRADAQYEQEVAIKIVRSGFETRDMRQRFIAERQILADLNHPNVARLLDGGTTQDGLPYLVMELIEGERIDRYCDRLRLQLSERLALFLRVCDAVQFAHQRLVIHRDIKTANILVTHAGVPKLLDFGVAKLLQPDGRAAEQTLFHPFTPAYASPEQILGEPLTTASDVFSLGVVLFEILTGCSPFDDRMRSARAVNLHGPAPDVQRPSAAFAALARASDPEVDAVSAESLARSRGCTPARLQRLLGGDLDAIAAMATRGEPTRRYASVQQLADDVDRYLRGRPVMAHQGSWRYRVGKFARRNAVVVAATATAIAALATGLALSLHQAQVARIERQRADARFEDVRRLANGLIFDVNGAMADTPGNTRARKLLLDRAVQYLDKLALDAAGDSALQRELAWGYQKLAAVQGNTTQSNVGEISAADRSLRKALRLFEAVYSRNPGDARSGLELAMSHRLVGLSDIYYPGGPPELASAAAILDQLAREHPHDPQIEIERCRTYSLVAFSLDLAGERRQALEHSWQALDWALELRRRVPSLAHVDEEVASLGVDVGTQLSRVGRLAEGEAALTQAVQRYSGLVTQSSSPDAQRSLAHAQLLLSRLNAMRGRVAEAERNLDAADASFGRLLRADPDNSMLQWDVASTAFDRGRLLALRDAPERMLPLLAPSLERYAAAHEDDSGPGYGLVQAWNAMGLLRAGRYAEALRALGESVKGLKGEPLYADARSGLAEDSVLEGEVRLRLRDRSGAQAAYGSVLATLSADAAAARGDMAALFALAGAQAGMGLVLLEGPGSDTATASDGSVSPTLRTACRWFETSAQTWGRIPESSTFSPDQFPGADRESLRRQRARCASIVIS